MRPRSVKIQQALQSALAHLNSAQLQQAGRICQDILKVEPGNAEANHLFGIINCQAGQIDAGISYIRQAIKSKPAYVEAHKNLGKALKTKGNPEEAAESYQRALDLAPGYAEVQNELGNTYYELGSYEKAAIAYRQAIAIVPGQAGFYNNLGNVLKKTGKYDEAISCCQKALSIAPDYAEAHTGLGNIYGELGNFDKAEASYRRALSIKPDYAEAYNNLGNMLLEQGRPAEALPCYQKALAIKPGYAEAYSNLGKALIFKGALSDAVASCRKAISLQPGFAEAYYNLGNAIKEQGFLEKALANYRQALSLKTDLTIAHSSILFTLNYLDKHSQEEIYQEALQWDQQFAQPLLPSKQLYQNTSEENRILRIGYVSQDFRNHSVAYFFEPTLQAHDRKDVEVFCYVNVKKPDEVTERLQAASDQWRSIVGLRNEDVAERIREDRIDILVDLAGHTAENRLLVFAYKPAPIQISWLGYPNTTGIKVIDYRFTDAIADPPGEADRFYTEELIRLEHGFLCYKAEEAAPDVSELPCIKNGFITFGSFNNLAKVTAEVVECWSEILRAVPGAHLLMKSKPLADKETKARYLKMFEEKGIQPERIELLGWLAERNGHLGLYNKVDIGLDPFPYNGTTTTCEALWMGVPVITLLGERHAGRVGASIMHQVDLEEMVAGSLEEYVQMAQELGNDRDLLVEMRGGLRQHMRESGFMDRQLFTQTLESAYRQLWKNWCADSQ